MRRTRRFTGWALVVTGLLALAVASHAAPLYYVDFNQAVGSAPATYVPAGAEVLPAGATMTLRGSPTIEAAPSGIGAEGGNALRTIAGTGSGSQGYAITGGPALTGSWTAEAIIRVDSISPPGNVAGLQDILNSETTNPANILRVDSSGTIHFYPMYNSGGGASPGAPPIASEVAISPGAYQHVAAVWNQATEQAELFLNGVSQGTKSRAGHTGPTFGGAFAVSNNYNPGYNPRNIDGIVDAFAVTADVLAPSQFVFASVPMASYDFAPANGETLFVQPAASDLIAGRFPTSNVGLHGAVPVTWTSLTDGLGTTGHPDMPSRCLADDGQTSAANPWQITYDLGGPCSIDEVRVFTQNPDSRVFQDYDVEVSSDGQMWTSLASNVTNGARGVSVNDWGDAALGDWSATSVRRLDGAPMAADVEQVRLTLREVYAPGGLFRTEAEAHGGSFLYEVDILGERQPDAPAVLYDFAPANGETLSVLPATDDLIAGKLPDSNQRPHPLTPSFAPLTDGQGTTGHPDMTSRSLVPDSPAGQPQPWQMIYTLGPGASVNEVRVFTQNPDGRVFQDYDVEVSADGVNWTMLRSNVTNGVRGVSVNDWGDGQLGDWSATWVNRPDGAALATDAAFLRLTLREVTEAGTGGAFVPLDQTRRYHSFLYEVDVLGEAGQPSLQRTPVGGGYSHPSYGGGPGIVDGDPATVGYLRGTWPPGSGTEDGGQFGAAFDGPSQVTAIAITQDGFPGGAGLRDRLQDITVHVGNGLRYHFTLADQYGPQLVTLPHPVPAGYVLVTADSAYANGTDPNMGIVEFEAFGRQTAADVNHNLGILPTVVGPLGAPFNQPQVATDGQIHVNRNEWQQATFFARNAGRDSLTVTYPGPRTIGSVGIAWSEDSTPIGLRDQPRYVTLQTDAGNFDIILDDLIQYGRYDLPTPVTTTFARLLMPDGGNANHWFVHNDANYGVAEFQAFEAQVIPPLQRTAIGGAYSHPQYGGGPGIVDHNFATVGYLRGTWPPGAGDADGGQFGAAFDGPSTVAAFAITQDNAPGGAGFRDRLREITVHAGNGRTFSYTLDDTYDRQVILLPPGLRTSYLLVTADSAYANGTDPNIGIIEFEAFGFPVHADVNHNLGIVPTVVGGLGGWTFPARATDGVVHTNRNSGDNSTFFTRNAGQDSLIVTYPEPVSIASIGIGWSQDTTPIGIRDLPRLVTLETDAGQFVFEIEDLIQYQRFDLPTIVETTFARLLFPEGSDPSLWYLHNDANYGLTEFQAFEYPLVPEPATLALLGLGLAVLAHRRRRG